MSGAVAVRVALMFGGLMIAGPARAQDGGSGWTTTRLDLDVGVRPAAGRIELRAELRLRLDTEQAARRLTLVMNGQEAIMGFDSVSTDRGIVAAIDASIPGRTGTRGAFIDFPDGAPVKGDVVTVVVHASSRATAQQFSIAEDVALASWVTVWYPVPLPSSGRTLAALAKAPGETRFDLPAEWRVVSNGSRVDVRQERGRTFERWRADQPLARSFAAAPYRVVVGDAGSTEVELLLLTVSDADARAQAATLAGAIAALEQRFGPYPTGSYRIAEVPEWVPGFLASSEQGFMMAKPENFAVPGGNIPLLAHEAAHGYWGNLVNSTGSGSAFLSESIAQYGAVIALEKLLGPDAALDFLKFSREGYIPLQSARGYFEVVRRGADSVAIADLRDLNGIARRAVVDSKGTWVYHMLRHLVGDERFFAVLSDYLRDHENGESTLPELRAAFRRAAPDVDVSGFFAQWLDRTGAPRFRTTWTRAGERVEVVVEQLQPGEPFVLQADLRVVDDDGRATTHPVHLRSSRDAFTIPAPRGVSDIVLDPGFEILRWDPAYAMEPAKMPQR